MNIRMQAMSQSTVSVTAQAAPGGSKEEMSPGSISPAQTMASMSSPHHSGIGMKPGTQKPPAAVLQVVKQVKKSLMLTPGSLIIYHRLFPGSG